MISSFHFADAPWSDGSELALIQASGFLDYADLCARAIERAEHLRQQGLGSGMLVLAPDSPGLDLVLMQHALARMGAVLLPYRAGLATAGLRGLAEATGAEWQWLPETGRLMRTDSGAAESHDGTSSVEHAVTSVPVAGSASLSEGDVERPRRDQGNADAPTDPIALLIGTSGSRGAPKVAMLTSGHLLHSAVSVNRHLGLKAGDRWLCCLRLSHVGGATIVYRCALAGAALLLHEGFDAEAVRRDLWDRPVTHVSLVPPMLARLLDLDPSPPPALRVLLVGGQALSRSLARRALDAGWPLHLTYGMTETGSQVATTERLIAELPEAGLVGHLLPGIQIEARGCARAPAPLRLRGPLVMAGYANPERHPGQGLEDGWFEAPDLGCMAEDGQLKVLGRTDDIRVIGGNNVSLARVEAALQGAPGLVEVVVVALPDPVWGHRLAAVYTGERDSGDLQGWCRAHLAGPEQPRAFLRLPRLPLLASGKYDRMRIELLAGRWSRPTLES